MNHTEHSLPLSLMSYFNAPDEFTGSAGMLCGYSADAVFMQQAIECFSGASAAIRSCEGDVYLAMMLDRGSAGIQHVPGLLHMGATSEVKEYNLLHAKVALLNFRNRHSPNQWLLRMIVSTGNWTEQTLTESLDLAWCIEVNSSDLNNKKDDDVKLRCADIHAAWELLNYLHQHHDYSLLNIQGSSTQKRFTDFKHCIEQCATLAKQKNPRFFDNRESSLLGQLPEQVKLFASSTRRNYLAMGSGFYETAKAGQLPVVPKAIMDSLIDAGLLTQHPETDIFVNPEQCQGVAAAVDLFDSNITVRPAHTPEVLFGKNSRRSLHAKFIFSANQRENSPTCNSAWVYLGSGNLTPAGFTEKTHAKKGNVEAGVVFNCEGFNWHLCQKRPSKYQAITNVLPIQWHDSFDEKNRPQAGDGMEEREVLFMAPRIPYVVWQEKSNSLKLPENCYHLTTDVELLNHEGSPCMVNESGYIWQSEQPRLIRIRWQSESDTIETIPVVDATGRIAATEYFAQTLNDALADLMGFPFPPNMTDDEDGSDPENDTDGSTNTARASHPASVTDYPIRSVMLLVEKIAEKQCALTEPQWDYWCKQLENRLRHLDVDCEQQNPLLFFRNQLKTNPLYPLRNPAFLPEFAEDRNSEAYQQYATVLDRIEAHWSLDIHSLSNQLGQ